MDIRIFSKYYQLSLKDKVIPIRCRMDEDHPYLVPSLDEDDNIYLYCLACNFKLSPGLELYRDIELVLKELDNNGKD